MNGSRSEEGPYPASTMDVHENTFDTLAAGGFQDSAWNGAATVARWDVEVFGCVEVCGFWKRCFSCSSHLAVLWRSDLDMGEALLWRQGKCSYLVPLWSLRHDILQMSIEFPCV